jgi:pyrroline-5-carboxylate reductase
MALKLDGDLVLAGAGNMGGAMLAGWLEGGLDPKRIVVQDPSPPPRIAELLARHGVKTVTTLSPSQTPPAGKTIAGFERHLPKGSAVVRSIPNTPASVGRGITVAAANAHVTQRQKALCNGLLAAIGEVAWVDDEALIDPVTAVSGSGPAYVFYLAECLAEAGVKAGLAPDLAAKLARWTVAGAGELLHRSDQPAGVLRQNVTSPNGTTFAALQVLMGEKGLQPIMTEAVIAATKRSKELAG